MRLAVMTLALVLSIGLFGAAWGQTIEVALKCEDVKKKLSELSKATDIKDISEVNQSLGVTVLMSCDLPSGKVVCYQCLDKDQKLRSLEVVHDSKARRVKVIGFGCRCRDRK